MKVLEIIPDLAPATGGPVMAAYGLGESLAHFGHAVTIASSDYGYDPMHHSDRVAVRVFPCRYDRWRWTPALADFLQNQVRNYDIVCVESLWQYSTLIGSRICRRAGVPYIVSTNGMLNEWSVRQKSWKKFPYLRVLEAHTLRGAAALHATSESECLHSSMQRWNRCSFVLPLGLPPSAYNNLPPRTAFGERFPVLKDRPYLLFLGRVHYKKQPGLLIRAFKEISAAHPDLLLVIAGPGEPAYVRRMQKIAADLDLSGRVIFTGILKGRAATEAFRGATLFCLPSLHENFGVAVAEAMAAECPVVISTSVDLAPFVEKARAGLTTAPALASTTAALRDLLRSEADLRSMGQNGRRFVLQHFTWDKVTLGFIEVFADILAGTRKSKAWRDRGVPLGHDLASAVA